MTRKLHRHFVYDRRMEKLSSCFANSLTADSSVLDVGCGDGKIGKLIMDKIQAHIEGIDVLVRDTTYIPVKLFDGYNIPFDNNYFDFAIIIDVLHHTDDPLRLLKEIKRVVRKKIFIKDHLLEGFLAEPTLRFMDYVGNAHYKVRLPYNYLSKDEWLKIFDDFSLSVSQWKEELNLYPPWNLVFDRKLHFIADLVKSEPYKIT